MCLRLEGSSRIRAARWGFVNRTGDLSSADPALVTIDGNTAVMASLQCHHRFLPLVTRN
jgi:hypothetical protein